jgi:hypothetical protein
MIESHQRSPTILLTDHGIDDMNQSLFWLGLDFPISLWCTLSSSLRASWSMWISDKELVHSEVSVQVLWRHLTVHNSSDSRIFRLPKCPSLYFVGSLFAYRMGKGHLFFVLSGETEERMQLSSQRNYLDFWIASLFAYVDSSKARNRSVQSQTQDKSTQDDQQEGFLSGTASQISQDMSFWMNKSFFKASGSQFIQLSLKLNWARREILQNSWRTMRIGTEHRIAWKSNKTLFTRFSCRVQLSFRFSYRVSHGVLASRPLTRMKQN